MSIGTFLGGMGQAYEGAQQGVQHNIDRENAADDRTFLADQRQFQQGQQARTVAAQGREDEALSTIRALPSVGSEVAPAQAADGGSDANTDPSSIDAQNGSDVGFDPTAPAPQPQLVTQDAHLRQVADAYAHAGDTDKAFQLHSAADQLGMQRSAREFAQLQANIDGMSTLDVANAAAKIYNNDPMVGQVKSVKGNADGSVDAVLTNTQTGQLIPVHYKTPADILAALQARYSPDQYAAIQQIRAKQMAEAQAKIEESRAAPVTTPAGATTTFGAGDPRSTLHVDKTFRPQATPPVKRQDTPLGQAQTIIADAFEKGDVKAATPKQRADAEDYADRVLGQNPNMPPARAAKIAVDAATNPAATQPAIAPNGTIDLTYVDSDGARYRLVPNIADAASAKTKGITPEMMTGAVKDLLTQSGDDAAQARLVKAATDNTARAALVTDLQAQATKVADQAIEQAKASGSTVPEQTIRQNAMFRAQQDAAALSRKLDLIKAFPPAAAAPAPGGSSLSNFIKPAGGMPVGDPAAPVPAGFGPLDQRVASTNAAKQVADNAAAAKTKATADAVTAGQKEAAWLTPDRIHAMSPAEIQKAVEQFGSKLTKAQASEIYTSRFRDLRPDLLPIIERNL